MEFIHQPYSQGETIAAVATPPGDGGVAIVRITGNYALDAAEKLFSGPVKSYLSHTVHFGKIHGLNGDYIDDVLLLVLLGTRSFTGEDTVEIQCHGGRLVTRRILEAVFSTGVRAALPGEFTFRSFIHGKIDLVQAEAIQELIGAKNERALDAAEHHLKGSLSKTIGHFQHTLTNVAAVLEAWVDFPEEGLEFATFDELNGAMAQITEQMRQLVATFHEGKIIHDGLSLCIVGRPNVGKSSLMNALLDKDRAITSPIAGTTRDVLEDHLLLNGLHLKLSDTAGIREATDEIEKEGIRRSRKAIEEADLILFVLDATENWHPEDALLFHELPKDRTIIVWNKIDLAHPPLEELNMPHVAFLSALQHVGLDRLHKMIDAVIWQGAPPSKEEVMITSLRHKEALLESILYLERVQDGIKTGVSAEFITFDMRQALAALGKIIGVNVQEEILSTIFSKFCIGK